MNPAANAFMSELAQRNPGEREFLQSVEHVVESIWPVLDHRPELRESRVLERMVEPERSIIFRVPWVDDRGKTHVNRGFRVQFNSAIGPYKGGLRFHASVNLSIIKFLAFSQTLKNALTTLPMGGGKGGSDFSPKDKSDAEVMRFCQAYMTELFRHLGPDTDVPAGDIGVGGREIGYMFGQYKRLVDRFEGFITGKGIDWGGSLIRKEAAGYGTVYFAQEMLATRGLDFQGKTVTISGYGNLGSYAMQKVNELGGKVVTIADEHGFCYDPNGIKDDKFKFVEDLWQVNRQPAVKYYEKFKSTGVEYHEGQRPWRVPCEIAIPTGAENELDDDDAKLLVKNGCICVSEGANMPCTTAAIKYFQTHNVLFGPGKAANAGGVATSGLEMSQNSMRLAWSCEEVDQKLHSIMVNIHRTCRETAEAYGVPGNYVIGANIAGFLKVANTMLDQGLV